MLVDRTPYTASLSGLLRGAPVCLDSVVDSSLVDGVEELEELLFQVVCTLIPHVAGRQ